MSEGPGAFARFNGRFEHPVMHSPALEGNRLGDPAERPLWVYLPPDYEDSDTRYPAIYVIQGFLNQVETWWNRSAFKPTVPERVDQLFSDPDVPPAILVFVDAWTSVGGSQFVNSPATGRYLDYLADDVVYFVDERFRTLAHRDHRAISGHSSGGFGAMHAAMLRPDVFGGFATHSGDALFELCYLPDVAAAARALRDRYHGSYDEFWHDFRSRPAFSRSDDATLLNVYAMSACYSPEADGAVTLPFDPASGLLRFDVWNRWLQFDPVRMAFAYAEDLSFMRAIYVDAGKSDEYNLDLGATAFSAELKKLNIDHFFELFEGRHGGVDFRYPIGWRYLAERISPERTGGEARDPTRTGTEARATGHPVTLDHADSPQTAKTSVNKPKKLIVQADGASRGNPGLAGMGVVIRDEAGRTIESLHDFLGAATNNQAEYRALIAGLKAAAAHQPESVAVQMDSQLVIRQMSGDYKVRHPDLLPLYLQAVEAASSLPEVTFEYVPRIRNSTADQLANMAIDSRMTKGRGAIGE